jgi:hypothetical protein
LIFPGEAERNSSGSFHRNSRKKKSQKTEGKKGERNGKDRHKIKGKESMIRRRSEKRKRITDYRMTIN